MNEYQFMIASQQKMIESQADLIKTLRETIAAKDAKIEALRQAKSIRDLEIAQLKARSHQSSIAEDVSNGWVYS